jgi:uncharacterized protein
LEVLSRQERSALTLNHHGTYSGLETTTQEEVGMASNADLHRQMDEALNKGDVDTAQDLMAEDMVSHFIGDNPFAGDYRGRDAFFEVFQQVTELTDGNFSAEHRDVMASEEHSVALSKLSATRKGRPFEGDVVDICRWRDGQLVEEWIIPFDQQAFDAFWS